MKRSIMRWVKAVLTLFVLLTVSCEPNQSRKSCSEIATAASVAKGGPLRVITTELFSIEIPESLRETSREGDVSQAWEYADENMSVSLEMGLYVSALGDHLKKYREYCEESRMIDGELVKTVSLNFATDVARIDPSKPYFVGTYFPETDRVPLPMNISISFQTESDIGKAYQIINSFRLNVQH